MTARTKTFASLIDAGTPTSAALKVCHERSAEIASESASQ
jgi:hypothetical protein